MSELSVEELEAQVEAGKEAQLLLDSKRKEKRDEQEALENRKDYRILRELAENILGPDYDDPLSRGYFGLYATVNYDFQNVIALIQGQSGQYFVDTYGFDPNSSDRYEIIAQSRFWLSEKQALEFAAAFNDSLNKRATYAKRV